MYNAFRWLWPYCHKFFPSLAFEIDFRRRNNNFEKDVWLTKLFCGKEFVSIDVGANQGLYSHYLSKFSARVIAFECNPFLTANLRRTLPKNVQLYSVALSQASGVAKLRFDPENTGIGTIEPSNSLKNNKGIKNVDAIDVAKMPLDELGLELVSFMKIDIEGHELDCLKGAENLLRTSRPVLLIEIEERHCPGNLDLVPEYLAGFGYIPFVLSRSGNHLIPIGELASYANIGINNFWFMPIA
jgi:FkbM family methyltransferase